METEEFTGPRSDRDADVLTVRRPSPRALLTALVVVLAILIVLDAIAFASGRESGERFYISGEFTLGMWWASVQLLLLGSVLSLVALREIRSGRRKAALTLGVGAFAAVFWSIDKTVDFKGTITEILRARDALPSLTNGSAIWTFIGSVVGIVLLALIVPGISSLLRTDRMNALLTAFGMAVNLFGSVVIEAAYRTESHAASVTKETVEFLGLAIMVWAIYRMLGNREIRSPLA